MLVEVASVVFNAKQARDRRRDAGPHMIAVGPVLVQRAPFFGHLARRVPMLMHQDGGQLIHFLIGHPMM